MANCGTCDSQKYCAVHRPAPTSTKAPENMSEHLQEQINSLEQIVAQLTAAYAEIWVVVESILNEVMTERSPEDKETFWKNLDEVRKRMYLDINKASRTSVDGTDPDFADAVENLVTGQRADPAS